ncbi:MAG: diphthine synthase [Sclerophora amabilis]|nr:MAG: diphthine synthase [Sclerophora amabilis]
MLILVGLGLADETDITVKGLEAVKTADRVYLEAYTSILLVDRSKLEAYYGRPVIEADREMVENSSDDILAGADEVDVAFLVIGDPFGQVFWIRLHHHHHHNRATTHTDLVLRAQQLGIRTRSIPNASILSAIGATGLQLYNFGQTVSMVFFTDTWKPSSFYDRVAENRSVGLHTLLLLDIKVKEQSLENMARAARGRRIYEPPRFMTVAQCATQMLETEHERREGVYGPDALAVGAARVGARDQTFVAGTLSQLREADLGPPLHSLVLLGKRTHDLEREYIRQFAIDTRVFDEIWQRDYEGKQ